ncbi:MAG: murein biosynthesis integral membrane protein MurJ [Rhodobacteraceae bacterium]|nr:murein biosynthesis integral membrane protein MurJ [Paracoccaceae bacterium]
MSPIQLAAGFLTVGLWTFASRIAGFLRDILIAAYLGAGPAAEAFLVAFALPNLFRRFFAEGALNMAFVPILAKKVEAGEDAAGFARDAFAGLAAVLLLLTLVAQAAMPWLVLAMAGGFGGDARLGLAVLYGRIAFPYILFIALAALLSGVLNSLGRFWAAAAAPLVLNVVLVAAILLAAAAGKDIGLALAWAVPAAGIGQLALVGAAAARAGFAPRPVRPRLTPDLRRLAVVALPAMLAGGVVQINLLVGRQVASFTDGAIAWLAYADRLYQLPLGVVGIAIGVVLLPDLARRLRAGDVAGGRWAFSRAAEFALALTLPASVALVVIALPIVAVLFERGAFDASDSARTALALAIYGAGLPAFVLQKVLQPLYYAREDTRSPFRFAVVSMVVNAAIAVGLMPWAGFAAAAWGTTLAGWAMAVQLWLGARAMGAAGRPDDRLRARLPRIVLATAAMGALLAGLSALLAPALAAAGTRYGALALLIGAGILAYFAAGFALGAFRPEDFRKSLRRAR